MRKFISLTYIPDAGKRHIQQIRITVFRELPESLELLIGMRILLDDAWDFPGMSPALSVVSLQFEERGNIILVECKPSDLDAAVLGEHVLDSRIELIVAAAPSKWMTPQQLDEHLQHYRADD